MSREAFGKTSGFSTIELIVVIGILSISMAATLPFVGSFQQTETLDTHTSEIQQVLKRAQHRAMTGQRNNAWGVKFFDDSFVLFSGLSYGYRNTAFDEVHPIAGEFQLSYGYRNIAFDDDAPYTYTNNRDIVFQKIWGTPFDEGIVRIFQPTAGTGVITVNSAGKIIQEE